MPMPAARRLLAPLVLTLALPLLALAAPSGVHGPTGAAIDAHVSRLAAFGISGALYVAKDGEVLVERGYGLAIDSTGRAISADDPFEIGSLSKQFTAAAILALEQDGRLSVGDSLGKFFPGAPAATRGITLHQLLSHTSGLPYLTERPFFETRPRDSVMAEFLALPLERAPGTQYAYSNPGFTLLGGVIERASGRRFEDYLADRIFRRAGLTRTRCLDPALRDTADILRVHSYSGTGDEGTAMVLRDMSKSVGAGSVITTARDLGRWARVLETNAVLDSVERAKLFTPHASVAPNVSYGYGWNVAKTGRGTTMYQHAGDIGGWNADMRIDRDARLVIVFLSNRRIDGAGCRGAVMNPVTLIATGNPPKVLPPVHVPSRAELAAVAGRWSYANGGTLVARASGRALEVAAVDSAGLAVLTTGFAAPPESLGIGGRALAFADAVVHLRHDAYGEALHPSLPANEATAELDSTAARATARHGAFVRLEPAGLVATGPGASIAFVRIVRERGSALLRLGFAGPRIIAFDFDAPSILPTAFLPSDDHSWVHVDPFTARVTRLRTDRDPGGRVRGLVVEGTTGTAHTGTRTG